MQRLELKHRSVVRVGLWSQRRPGRRPVLLLCEDGGVPDEAAQGYHCVLYHVGLV